MKDLLICVSIICTIVLVYSESFLKKEQQTIVLISFDGFRHDYIKKYDLQNFKKLSQNGVKASELEPTFVTKTFPNHFTIVTGLYEETHGIVSNRMYDPLYKEEFDVSNTDPKWWNATTPIWIENEIKSRHKVQIQNKYKSATIFWPGSEVRYNNKYPYFTFKKYNPHYSFQARFNKIVDLLLDDYPVNFIAAYFEEPDKTSHKYGINSTQLKLKLSSIDKLFGYFLRKIQRANLYNKVNIIVVSDHGMTNVYPKNVYTLTDYVDPNSYDLYYYGAFAFLHPKPGFKEEIYQKLKKIPHTHTYYKENIPSRWHYQNNRRIPEIFSLAEEGFYISPDKNTTNNITGIFGAHGYDNRLKSMHGIFIAHGPSFKKNLKVKLIKNIDIYELMCFVLQITPHSNNGSLDRIKFIVDERTIFKVIMKHPALVVTLLSLCAIFVFVVVLGCTVSCYRNLKESSQAYRPLSAEDERLLSEHEMKDVS